MRLGITLLAALAAAAISGVAIAPALAQGESVVELSVGRDDPALAWDIDVTGGSSSVDSLTLAPIALGFRGEFRVAVPGSSANVTLSPVLSAEFGLASVGCLDDRTPPAEIQPAQDRSSFVLDVVPGRRYSCFATSLPTDALAPVAPIAAPTQAAAAKPLPRSDSAAPPAPPVPGWLVVLATVVVIGGIAMILRPARR